MLINGEQVADMPGFMNMDMSNVLNIGYSRSLHRRRRGRGKKKKEKRSSRVGKRDRGRQISFLHTETVKVSQKPVIKCIMCHVLVSHIVRDWKADRELCAPTTLSRASFPLFFVRK